MKKKIFLVLFLTLFFCLVQMQLSNAKVAKRLNIEEMTEEAGIILEGKVTSVKSEWNYDHTQIYTFVEITVAEYIKGALEENEITLRVLGGAVGDTAMTIVEAPSFLSEEEVFLFLRPRYRGLFPVIGLYQGKFHMETDVKTGKKVLKNELGTFGKQELIEQVNKALLKK